MLRPLLVEVAQDRGAKGVAMAWKTIFMILQAELPRVLADDLDIGPAQPLEALTRNFAERGREVDKIHAGEELRDIDVFGHGLNVPSCATANLDYKQINIKD